MFVLLVSQSYVNHTVDMNVIVIWDLKNKVPRYLLKCFPWGQKAMLEMITENTSENTWRRPWHMVDRLNWVTLNYRFQLKVAQTRKYLQKMWLWGPEKKLNLSFVFTFISSNIPFNPVLPCFWVTIFRNKLFGKWKCRCVQNVLEIRELQIFYSEVRLTYIR